MPRAGAAAPLVSFGAMSLPFDPPIEPMLAKAVDALPSDDGWLFEPKWDGFRAIVSTVDGLSVRSRRGWQMRQKLPELPGESAVDVAGGARLCCPETVVSARDEALDDRLEGVRFGGGERLELLALPWPRRRRASRDRAGGDTGRDADQSRALQQVAPRDRARGMPLLLGCLHGTPPRVFV